MTSHDSEPRVDRTAFSVVDVGDESDGVAYWKSRTPAERLAHLELLRRINYGDAAAGRIDRVLEVVPLPWARTSSASSGELLAGGVNG